MSNTTPSHHNSSLPAPHPLGYRGRGPSEPNEFHLPSCNPHPTQNRALAARFCGFGPKPAPLRTIERTPPSPPPTRPPHHTKPLYRPLAPFSMARTRPSPVGSVSAIWPQTPAPARVIERSPEPPLPPHIPHLPHHLHHTPPPFPMAHTETSHSGSVSSFCPKP